MAPRVERASGGSNDGGGSVGDIAWLDTDRAAEELGVSRSRITYLCMRGELEAVKQCRRWRVNPESIRERKDKKRATLIRYDILEDKLELARLVGKLGMMRAAERCRCSRPTVRKYLRIHNLKKITKKEFGEALVRAYKRVGVEPEGCPPHCPEPCLNDGVCVFEIPKI